MKKYVEVTCPICTNKFQRYITDYNRSVRLNKPMYCSLACAGKVNWDANLGDKKNFTPPTVRRTACLFSYYLNQCSKRKHKKEVTITCKDLQEVWDQQQGICPYSGFKLELSTLTKRAKDKRYAASVDRIDSAKGYIPGNVQFVSTLINYMKSDLTDEEVKGFIMALREQSR
jgi:uncharacterized protein YeeX (DUF496 family)